MIKALFYQLNREWKADKYNFLKEEDKEIGYDSQLHKCRQACQ